MRSQPTVCSSSARAYAAPKAKVARLLTIGLLDATGVDEATRYFRAFCDGVAGLELDATIHVNTGEHLWRTGLHTFVRGPTRP